MLVAQCGFPGSPGIMTRFCTLFLAGISLLASAASAQQIRGEIRDVTSEALLPGAVVMLLDAEGVLRETVLSDAVGAFSLQVAETDSMRLRVQRYGFATLESVTIRLSTDDSLRLEIRMRPEAIPVEGVTATARLNRSRNLEGFLIRQRMGYGKYLGPGEIARLRPRSTTVLLASVPGSPIISGGAGLGIVARSRDARNEPGMSTGTCVPTVYVDGLILRGEPTVDAMRPEEGPASTPHTRVPGVRVESYVAARTVRAVEVYQRPASAPPEFQRPLMAECPIVVIWTDFGFGLAMTR
jgi:hypothetical protein